MARDHELVGLLAYIAQVEWGDYHQIRCTCNNPHGSTSSCCYSKFMNPNQIKGSSFWDDVANSHKELKVKLSVVFLKVTMSTLNVIIIV